MCKGGVSWKWDLLEDGVVHFQPAVSDGALSELPL